MKRLFLFIIMLSLLSCQDGPKAAFNEEFEKVNPRVELSFDKLIGSYELDNDSKQRFKINDSIKYHIKITKDTSIVAEPFINLTTNKNIREKKGKLFYINDYRKKPYSLYLDSKDGDWNNNINIYYRKKDSLLALYIYTPPLKGQEHGDYLRYIKVK
ncbi:hypothetical protein CLU96_1378 [Chryseobacterium sp. 52]|uniref:hypothetical protein n=1 Tax=Chryseobacterium sp. 52 TaxID=2035213 RepID=UPI000C6703C3|nr:hypothetical protein [Chryseobacterium sp. 52]PIF44411.1 hypothetical protein CLU96_1378 [Chryseobacterium sp. 52]